MEPLPITNLVLVTEEAVVGSEDTTGLPSRQTQTPATPGCSSSHQKTGSVAIASVCADKRAVIRDSCRVAALVGPGLVESGFSAQQLSPLEIKFHGEDATVGGFSGYEAMQTNPSGAKTKPVGTQGTTQSAGMVPASYGTLPLIG